MNPQVPVNVEGWRVGPRILVPRVNGADLWKRTDVRQALATHDFAAIFRTMRAHGISQRKIAAILDCGQSEVSEILNGRHVTSYPVLVRYADNLEVPRSWLGLAYDDETERLISAHDAS